ncbi:MAG TPA: L,D-transpeptidase family protein [Novosphingobium sp.]|nr:L,D-transpeptidase family protein [Novosphingobium sp.]
MRLRKEGWTGLVVAVLGLTLAGAGLVADWSRHRAEISNAAALAPSPLTIDPAHVTSASTSAETAPAPAPTDANQLAADSPAPGVPPLVIKRILPIEGPLRYGEWHWDEAGVPAGPLVVTVDLDARVLSVFRGGYEIAATAVLLGTSEKPTPTGLFPITQKDADHRSNIYGGAPMPYMMRLTNDGVSIHGTRVENGYASHGCVGVPTPFAKRLFGIAGIGTPVYITRGKLIGLGERLT